MRSSRLSAARQPRKSRLQTATRGLVLESFESRDLLAAVTIDPQLFGGFYNISSDSSLRTGPHTYDLAAGVYNVHLSGSSNISFSVDASGNVTSNRPTSAAATGSTLTLLNSTVTIDPVGYQGNFDFFEDGAPSWSSGVHSFVVVPDMPSYDLQLSGLPTISFDVDAGGNVVSGRPTSATASGSTLTLRNSTVTVDPRAYQGKYDFLEDQVASWSSGVHSFVVIPDMPSYDLQLSGLTPIYLTFDVDASGNVISNRPTSATASGSTLTFRNSTVTIDPGAYQGGYDFSEDDVPPYTTGVHSFVVIPDMQSYDITLSGLSPLSFDVDASGNVISNRPTSATASGSTLTFRNSTVTIDPGAYQGGYDFSEDDVPPYTTGVHSFVVIPDMPGYDLSLSSITPVISFDVNASGDVTSNRPTSVTASGNTLTFRNTRLRVNPDGYVGTYTISGVSSDILGGVRDFVVVPDMQNYDLRASGVGLNNFSVNSAGTPNPAVVPLTIASVTYPFSLSYVAPNSPPVANPDDVAVDEDSADNTIDVLANDTDPDNLLPTPANDGLSVTAVGSASHGIVSLVGGVVTYTSAANYYGSDSFSYTISDSTGLTSTAMVSVIINNVADAPVANGDTATISEYSTSNVINVLANDTDADNLSPELPNAGLTVTAVGSASHGTVSLVGGQVYYTPTAHFYGSDSFTYTVSDGGLVATGTVGVTITNVDDAPIAVNDSATVSEDSTDNVINVLANDTDADNLSPTPANAGLTVTAVGPATHGTVSLMDGVVRYTPGVGCAAASDSFTYTIRDSEGNESTATVTVAIAPYTGVSTDGGILRVGGTDNVDVVSVSGGSLIVNGVPLSLAGVTDVRIWGRGGADQIDLSGLAVPAFIDGGTGNDILTGGIADDVIFGGIGDDILTGAAGNDLLVGGMGKDRIVGSAGSDILAAGDIDCSLDLAALREISQAWAISRGMQDESGDDLLGESVGDADSDQLTGSSGADLFIISGGDKITDFKDKPHTNKDGDVVVIIP